VARRRKIDPANTSLIELCVARGGWRKGTKVCSFIMAWAWASRSLGRPITVEEYAEWWREDWRTAYRHQALFRELFGEERDPQEAADIVNRARADAVAARGLATWASDSHSATA
jgi:hypothetical protein